MKSETTLWCRSALMLLTGGILFVAGCNNQDAEVAAQRQKELETVRAELEQTKTSAAAQKSELTELRKDNLELLKLRNEVRQLRDEKKQLSQQAQTAQVRAQQAQAQVQVIQSQAQQTAQALAAQQQAFAAQNTPPGSPQQQANSCINNLRQIDGAIQQWALEQKKDATAKVTSADISPYLKNPLACPSGGTYTLRSVSDAPTCSIPGHALPP